ncbi:molybdopterin-dependent oxidoreductase [Chromobacterium sp. IIBBL 290-4]|uniref:molybdopterin-dependent oxidoreductase n=1 Tax=Chromobacterium sp. IIBBL 290-4 TaxID=2953890 RepID=UPI0020B704B7|nr:molybdopterin-dependent oxidoreductase [Chromobacterium sp. IIBBL 290-4]UTH73479.1 molybdopterin-dependent oxidoreductase [Chromobacterium sp. IIBBL 290-4]
MQALRLAAMLLILSLGMPHAQGAETLDKPKGKIVLVISGQIAHKNRDNDAAFDMDMLAKLPQHTIATHTPWIPGISQFTGPYLQDVLAVVGAKGDKLKAIALNDYKTEIPLADAAKFNVVLARLLNGKPMSVRDKGPLFIVYPYDSQPALKSEIYYNRSAWQLKTLQVE